MRELVDVMSVHFFTNSIKVDVDVDGNEMSPLIFNTHNIRETIGSFARGPYYHLLKRYVFILLVIVWTKTKTVTSVSHSF